MCLAEGALALLGTGRPAMAGTLLEGLPDAVRVAVAEGYAAGVEHGLAEARRSGRRAASADRFRRVPAPVPAFAKAAAELAGHVEHLGADRVAAVLGVTIDDLGPLLEGRVAPPAGGLRRLRETTE
jgi:hypothetical protein